MPQLRTPRPLQWWPRPFRALHTRAVSAAALAALTTITAPVALWGQHPTRGAPPATTPAREAGQFDFLVGQWELEVIPKVSSLAARLHGAPKLLGSWKAWKVMDGFGIEDELRIFDRSGNPNALVLAVRLWSPAERRWMVTSTDAYGARMTPSTATWDGKSMLLATTDASATVRTRSRISQITANAFVLEQDRSEDGGNRWEEKVLVIRARRVAAAAPR